MTDNSSQLSPPDDELSALKKEVQRLRDIERENLSLSQSLHIAEEKFKKVVDSIPDIFYTLDEDGAITYISNAVIKYGYDPDELIGKQILDFVHPDDRRKSRFRVNERRTAERSTRSFELRFLSNNAEYNDIPFEIKMRNVNYEPMFDVSAEGYYDTHDHPTPHFLGTIGIARDITERKKADSYITQYRRELEEKVNDFKQLVNNLNSIGIALSSEHNVANLLSMIVSEVRRFTHSDGGSLYIKQNDTLSFEVAQNDTLDKREDRMPFKPFTIPINHNSIAGYVASTGEIINISNLDNVGDEFPFSLDTMRDFDRKVGYRSVSMLAVPMRNHRDEIIGVIQLINSLEKSGNPVAFDAELEKLVISLASQAAVAICNSWLIQEIKDLFESIVTYSAQAIDARSPHTAGHSERVAELTMLQAHSINAQTDGVFADTQFSDEELNELRIAAFLHDIGKIGVPERVLDKVNKLSDEKMEAIRYRFAYIRSSMELEGERAAKAAETINDSNALTQVKLAELDAILSFIESMNRPRFYSDEDGIRLNEIARKTYAGIDGTERPYIEDGELCKLLVRKGNLTAEERLEIENHVVHTLNILEKIPFTDDLSQVPVFAATHHEMLDGSGYPNGLTADDIPLQARMLAVADIYDALTAKDRPYKPPLPLNVTLKILREEADRGRLDKNLVELFISEETYSRMES